MIGHNDESINDGMKVSTAEIVDFSSYQFTSR